MLTQLSSSRKIRKLILYSNVCVCVCVCMCECEKIIQYVSALYMIFFVQVEAMKRAQYYFQVMCFMSISFTRLGGGGFREANMVCGDPHSAGKYAHPYNSPFPITSLFSS